MSTNAKIADIKPPPRAHLKGLAKRVYHALWAKGNEGATDEEMEKVLNGTHQSISAARCNLMHDGYVAPTFHRRPTASGRTATVYVAIRKR